MSLKKLVLIVFILFSAIAYSQTTMSDVMVDSKTLKPLHNVNLSIDSPEVIISTTSIPTLSLDDLDKTSDLEDEDDSQSSTTSSTASVKVISTVAPKPPTITSSIKAVASSPIVTEVPCLPTGIKCN